MRETKDQTITRLKRVNSELTERLRDINKKNRSTRREGKDKMTEILYRIYSLFCSFTDKFFNSYHFKPRLFYVSVNILGAVL